MNIGITFRLQVKGAKRRLSSELIGIDDGKYLIVKLPHLHTIRNVSTLFIKGNEINVKYMYRGSIFGFKSRIIELIHKPFKLVFIKYPDKVDSYDVRGNKRVECFLPANIKIAQHIVEGCITDISRTGCQFTIETPEHEDSINVFDLINETIICFHLPGIEEELRVDSKQRSIKKDLDGSSIGIEFIKMDNSVQTKLFAFLSIAEA